MSKENFTDKLIQGLRATATELEELRVQASLGKAEAKDRYDEARKKFNEVVHSSKEELANATELTKERMTDLKSSLEHLRVQVSLGKAEFQDEWDEQLKKIKLALHSFEDRFTKK